jgi:hypothetical protein
MQRMLTAFRQQQLRPFHWLTPTLALIVCPVFLLRKWPVPGALRWFFVVPYAENKVHEDYGIKGALRYASRLLSCTLNLLLIPKPE